MLSFKNRADFSELLKEINDSTLVDIIKEVVFLGTDVSDAIKLFRPETEVIIPNVLSFNVGETYTHNWIGDSDLHTDVKILKRTEKTVTVSIRGEKEKRCKIYLYDGVEYCKPYGIYSFSPSLYANKLKHV